jgi:hypothetical protein
MQAVVEGYLCRQCHPERRRTGEGERQNWYL